MYGFPEESRGPVRTVTLDLPAEVGSVYEVDGDKPPIEAYGPLGEDYDISGMEPRLPIDAEIDGVTVSFTFADPLGQGAWRIVVYQSRIRREDNGNGFELTKDDGNPWTGWTIQVLNDSPARSIPDPGTREPKPQPTMPSAKVYLDGDRVPSCASELSGEVLKAVVHGSGPVSLEIESLVDGARTPLYERYQTRLVEDPHEEKPHDKRVFRWASVGPIENYRWAGFHGTKTRGRLPLSGEELAHGTAVIRSPSLPVDDPLLSRSESTDTPSTSHPNTYEKAIYTATPHSVDVEIDSYDSPALLAPETIDDDTNTPETNPRLYPEGAYFPDGMPGPEGAIFDLPICSEMKLKVGGSVEWWGQTRLVPTLVEPKSAAQELPEADASTREARAKLQRKLWRASMEALVLWKGALPTGPNGRGLVVSTMRDYVLTSVALGTEYEEGTQGRVRGESGTQRFSAQGDRTLRRRKHRLAELLKEGEKTAPPMPEDHAPGMVAELAADADTPHYGRSHHGISQPIAPLYDPTGRESFQWQRRNLRQRFLV